MVGSRLGPLLGSQGTQVATCLVCLWQVKIEQSSAYEQSRPGRGSSQRGVRPPLSPHVTEQLRTPSRGPRHLQTPLSVLSGICPRGDRGERSWRLVLPSGGWVSLLGVAGSLSRGQVSRVTRPQPSAEPHRFCNRTPLPPPAGLSLWGQQTSAECLREGLLGSNPPPTPSPQLPLPLGFST